MEERLFYNIGNIMMHDSTLISIVVNWKESIITLNFEGSVSSFFITAKGFSNLIVPKRNDWGESVSVNEVEGPILLNNGNSYIAIEIQSGDKIEIEAKSICTRLDKQKN